MKNILKTLRFAIDLALLVITVIFSVLWMNGFYYLGKALGVVAFLVLLLDGAIYLLNYNKLDYERYTDDELIEMRIGSDDDTIAEINEVLAERRIKSNNSKKEVKEFYKMVSDDEGKINLSNKPQKIPDEEPPKVKKVEEKAIAEAQKLASKDD